MGGQSFAPLVPKYVPLVLMLLYPKYAPLVLKHTPLTHLSAAGGPAECPVSRNP